MAKDNLDAMEKEMKAFQSLAIDAVKNEKFVSSIYSKLEDRNSGEESLRSFRNDLKAKLKIKVRLLHYRYKCIELVYAVATNHNNSYKS